MLYSYTSVMDPLVLEIAQAVVQSADNITTGYSPVAFVQQPAEMTEYASGIHGHLTCLRKQPQEKQTSKLLATIHGLYVTIKWW